MSLTRMPMLLLSSRESGPIADLTAASGLGAPIVAPIEPLGPEGLCYWNCDDYVAAHGGEIVYGWQAAAWPPALYKLEHHAVVRKRNGQYVDPTTSREPNRGETVLFVDNSITPRRDYPEYVPNKFFVGEGGEQMADILIPAMKRQLSILREFFACARKNNIGWTPGKPMNVSVVPEMKRLHSLYEASKIDIDRARKRCEEISARMLQAGGARGGESGPVLS